MEIEEVLQTQIRDTSECKGGDVDIYGMLRFMGCGHFMECRHS